VPIRVNCDFSEPGALVEAFLRDIGSGGLSFTATQAFQQGDEVRIAIRTSADGEGLVLPAKVVSVATLGGGQRCGVRFINFDARLREEVRLFVEFVTGGGIARTEQDARTRRRRLQVSRQLILGAAVGIILSLAAVTVLILR